MLDKNYRFDTRSFRAKWGKLERIEYLGGFVKIVNVSKRNWTFLRSTVILFAILLLTLGTAVGQTQQDIEALKKLAEEQRESVVAETIEMETSEEIGPTMTEIEIPASEIDEEYFGYSFFEAPQTISLLNNLPVPEEYILGPGDEVVITLWGETELVTSHEISRSNTINIPRVGVLNLAGKNLAEAETFVKGRMQRAYSTLRGTNPRTFMSFSLGKLKSINVRFVGDVNRPGLYPIHPFSTITTGLMQSGGVNTTGSLRNIHVLRNGEIAAEMDLYAFLLKGKTDGDIRLQDQDVVLIPSRTSVVNIQGEVRRSSTYELKPDENLKTLIDYSGGLKATARSPIELRRVIPMGSRSSEDLSQESHYVSIENLSEWKTSDGDSVFVYDVLPADVSIAIRGQVKRPGIYEYTESMALLNALHLAGGIDDPDFQPTIFMERGEIIRKNAEGEQPIIIPFNVQKLLAGDTKENKQLMNKDVIILRKANQYHEAEEITVRGEVKVPGVYTTKAVDETLESIISRAGGFTDRAFEDGLIMMRDEKRVITTNYDIPVKHGDEITVPRRSATVEVMGEINNPAFIKYKRSKSAWDYIESAGGVTDYANKRNISVIYPNGDIKVKSWFRTPKVVEGSIVVVHRKQESVPFDLTAFLKDTASIAASLATIIFILNSK